MTDETEQINIEDAYMCNSTKKDAKMGSKK